MIILGPVAIAKNSIIGNNNELPWNFPKDLQNFQKLTRGKIILMGRKTFESIVKRLGKPLPHRKNVVITRQLDYQVPVGVLVFYDLLAALQALAPADIYLIGGSEIFRLALPFCELAYITHIHDDYPGDAWFPEIEWSNWKKISEEQHAKFSFVTYVKDA